MSNFIIIENKFIEKCLWCSHIYGVIARTPTEISLFYLTLKKVDYINHRIKCYLKWLEKMEKKYAKTMS